MKSAWPLTQTTHEEPGRQTTGSVPKGVPLAAPSAGASGRRVLITDPGSVQDSDEPETKDMPVGKTICGCSPKHGGQEEMNMDWSVIWSELHGRRLS